MWRAAACVLALAWVVFLGALVWLGRLDRSGPAHVELELAGGTPASFTVPGSASSRGLGEVPALDARPPGVVLCHGFAGDRRMLSSLARRLAASGYAVLAFDARGHGESRRRFAGGRPDHLREEFEAAVDFLRASPRVDGGRIALMGHSMGAGAALDFATRDSGLDAAVMISGGWTLEGPYRPPNALFVYAARDGAALKRASQALAARLRAEPPGGGEDPPDFSRGTAVAIREIAGTDQVTILFSSALAREVVAWLDASFGTEREVSPDLADLRLAALGLAGLALLPLLAGVGWLAGRLAPLRSEPPATGLASRLATLALGLAATLPLAGFPTPASAIPLAVVRELAGWLLAAGLALCGVALLRGALDLQALRRGLPRSLTAASLALVAVGFLLAPLRAVVHRQALTPERALAALALTLAFLPFFLALEWGLRRGGCVRATLAALAGRLLLLALLLAGVELGLLPHFLLVLLPTLVGFFLLAELALVPLHARSRDPLAVALLASAWLAWLAATTMPLL